MKKNRTLLTKTQISELEEDKIGRPVLALNENDHRDGETDGDLKLQTGTETKKQQQKQTQMHMYFERFCGK